MGEEIVEIVRRLKRFIKREARLKRLERLKRFKSEPFFFQELAEEIVEHGGVFELGAGEEDVGKEIKKNRFEGAQVGFVSKFGRFGEERIGILGGIKREGVIHEG